MTLRLLEQLVQRLKALLDVVPAGANIVTLTGAQTLTNKSIDGDDNTLTNLTDSTRAYAMVGCSTGATITNNNVQIIPFDIETDPRGAFTVGATGRFTVPTGHGGAYLLACSLTLEAGAQPGASWLAIYRNDAFDRRIDFAGASSNAKKDGLSGATLISLVAGDWVDFRVYQLQSVGTGSRTLTAGVSEVHASFLRTLTNL